MKLNSTIIHNVGIFAAARSAFVFVSVIIIFISTMILIPEDCSQFLCLVQTSFITLCVLIGACGGDNSESDSVDSVDSGWIYNLKLNEFVIVMLN